MPFEGGPDPNPPTADHILDWIEDSISFLPSFPGDPYNSHEINSDHWWDQDLIDATSLNRSPILIPDPPAPPELSKKRKQPNNLTPQPTHQQRHRNQAETLGGEENNNNIAAQGTQRKTVATQKRPTARTNGNQSQNNNAHKDARWAEQLLNPCALAIAAGNLSRIQHLLYVLHELASLFGDANHRLAAHGLRALTRHLSSSVSIPTTGSLSIIAPTFASTEPRLFQNSLIKFHELSPWFSFPNSLANTSILQTLATDPNPRRNLHILDIGVSHGVQWPTLLESLTRRTSGPPPLVRLTVVAAAENPPSFSAGPPGDDYPSRLLRFAKRIELNLRIDRIENHPLQALTPQILGVASREEETLIVCAQFRIHQLPHEDPADRTEFLQRIRDLEPDLVVLTENEGDCSCCSCGDFATGFPRRVEFLWKFLDSTSVAFKGRECEERRVMEGEAATALSSMAEMSEGKVTWFERMRGLGFEGEGFGEEAIEGGRALLRKYDNNWEMRSEEKGEGCIWLCWKGQPVSFCSLWKLPTKKS
ncbi:protein NODULATION SIGNALING PATHWAY 1 [Magnolia sinica]|uniref:protein NODULATION SIGNALING PATHWAY 1 n=1 Tax=Magnolia sinica TaxID=86752 RepID=UPI0026595002|nr:protein NODULATION SIGNALING PATHWAY 1 [Magnolia sinica]